MNAITSTTTKTFKSSNSASVTVTLSESIHGRPQPTIELRFPKGTSKRQVAAACYLVAANLELATPPYENWMVEPHVYNNLFGCVWINLRDCSEREIESAMQTLNVVTKR